MLRKASTVLVAFFALSSSAVLWAQESLGSAQISGSVRVEQAAAAPISLQDTRYAMRSGDRVTTAADSTMVLQLADGGGQLALTPESVARFQRTGNRFDVELEQGNLLYLLCAGREVVIAAGGIEVEGDDGDQPPPDQERKETNVSGAGIVARLDAQGAAIAVREGQARVMQGSNLLQRLQRGEEYTFFGGGVGLDGSVFELVEDESELRGTAICGAPPIASGNRTAWVVGGVVLGAAIWYERDRRRDRRPASP